MKATTFRKLYELAALAAFLAAALAPFALLGYLALNR